MSLRDYVAPTRTIALGAGNKMAVRALGFSDMQHLVITRHGLVDTALALFGDGFDAVNADDEQIKAFGVTLITKLPDLVAEVIATAADEPDMADTVMLLPGPVQLDALIAVYELTFPEPGDLGKFFGRLADLATAVPKNKAALPKGNGASQSAGSSSSGAMSAS